MTFQRELQQLINRHSMENLSNTPDMVLAAYLQSCLDAFNAAVQQRDNWYGVELTPGGGTPMTPGPTPLSVVRDLLKLVAAEVPVMPTIDQCADWAPDVREAVADWASAVHLCAADNDVVIPPRPEVLG